MKSFVILFLMACACTLQACDFKSKPYLKHELKYDKVAGDCYGMSDAVSIDANTIGERYIFNECLNASFNGSYAAERRGDTVIVRIGEASQVRSVFRITLDINTRPTYHFIDINGKTMAVTVQRD